ncbi:MAG TPA: alanine racemase [Candidatus Hydrogenedentes bacterium]|nr:alanine racemase [Candidatus Hydrogenedentota bacterium]HPG68541.1 alanine racemase [Candidatus Hydrogenedentota bacterium]
MPASSRAIIDLNAYGHNLDVVRNHIPRECGIMAVVKTNAYGLGGIPLARHAVDCGVDMLAVATVSEGIALREAGIHIPVLVLVQPSESHLADAVEHDLRVTVSEPAFAERLSEIGRRMSRLVPIHFKVDTGMGRQGVDVERALDTMEYLVRLPQIDIEGIATHFAQAEIRDDPFTLEQIRAFKKLLRDADKAGLPYDFAHAANSAGIVNYPHAAFDMVRPGLMTYGVWPYDIPAEQSPLRPVLRWISQTVVLKDIEAGQSVGYGRTYRAEARMRVAVVPVGYADGYRYHLANRAEVLVRGVRCPVRGSVCMDQIVVDVTGLEHVRLGDTVTLIGTDGSETITPWELAKIAGTVPNDILTGLGWRVAREYVD